MDKQSLKLLITHLIEHPPINCIKSISLAASGDFSRLEYCINNPYDFSCCLFLIRRVPEVRNVISEMGLHNYNWQCLDRHWTEIEACFAIECGFKRGWWCSKRTDAPETNRRIKFALNGGRVVPAKRFGQRSSFDSFVDPSVLDEAPYIKQPFY